MPLWFVPPSRQTVAEIVIPTLTLGVVLGLLWLARDSLAPFVVGMLVAYVLQPAVRALEGQSVAGRRVPRELAILGVYLVALAAIVGFVWVTLPPLLGQVRDLITRAPGYVAQAQTLLQGAYDWYATLAIDPAVRAEIDERISGLGATALSTAQSVALAIVTGTGRTVGFLFGFLFVPIWTFFVLRDERVLKAGMERLVPAPWRPIAADLVTITDRVLGKYLRGVLTLMVVVGVATAIGALILGMTVAPTVGRYALLLGVVAGLTNALPIVGPFLGGAVGLALSVVDGPVAVVWTILLYLVIQQLEGNILAPKIMGDALDLRPALMLVALVVGADLFGLVGALLAAPTVAWAREIVRYVRYRLDAGPPPPMLIAPSDLVGASPSVNTAEQPAPEGPR
ncbi:MAG: AI-2E family transporter [Dehalococcoidia bacterium]|nr:AI-2E family transporter [Dehalococcoidia bacterium]